MFLYIQHAFVVKPGAKPNTPNFGQDQENNMIDERIDFSLKLNEKKKDQSTYVIDIINGKCIKNMYRYDKEHPISDDDVLKYIIREYDSDIKNFLHKFANELKKPK